MQRIKEFSVQQFIPQLPVKRFHVPIFPGTAWFDKQGRNCEYAIPGSQGPGDELRMVLVPLILWQRIRQPRHGRLGL